MHTFLQDLRLTLRGLRKAPAFAVLAILVLALGIGANTAVFTIVDALLFRPLQGRQAASMGLFDRDQRHPGAYRAFSYPDYLRIRAHREIVPNLIAQTLALVGVTAGDATRQVFASIVSSNYFDALGVAPAIGRAFTTAEERPGANIAVAIVNDGYWRAHGSDPHLLGQTIRINARPFTIVGVAPPGFTGTTAILSPAVWLPLGVYDSVVNDMFKEGATGLADGATHGLFLSGQLAPGLSPASATSRLQAVSAELAATDPKNDRDFALQIAPARRFGFNLRPGGDAPLTLVGWLLVAMAAIVLLIACLNLANMMLARGAARRRDVAVRLALGASRRRIVRQLLTEGAVLAIAGGALGLGLAYWTVRLLIASMVSRIPFALSISAAPDLRVLAATLVFMAASTVVFGLGPAWRLSHPAVASDLKGSDTRATEAHGRLSARNLMVVAQTALALALLTAGGLFTRGALRAASADPGFDVHHEIVASVDPSLEGLNETAGRQLYARLLERLRALPGVDAASDASMVPFGDFQDERRVSRGDAPAADDRDTVRATFVSIGAGYFRTLGLSIPRGREFTDREEDSAAGAGLALVDDALARRLFGRGDPIGQSIAIAQTAQGAKPERLKIVGVAPALHYDLFDHTGPHLYVASGGRYQAAMNLQVRVRDAGPGGDEAAVGVVRRALHEVDPQLPVISLRTMRDQQEQDVALWAVRTAARMFSTFGLLALLLAALGLYGVSAYLVSRRTREIGIRMALGAAPADVRRMILRDGLIVAGAGLAIGLGLAAALARLVAGLLYDVPPFDPVVFLGAAVALLGTMAAASWVPARRATRVAPLDALRTE